MHHIDIYLDNDQISTKNQNSLGIGHKKFQLKRAGGGDHKTRKCTKKLKNQIVDRIDHVD